MKEIQTEKNPVDAFIEPPLTQETVPVEMETAEEASPEQKRLKPWAIVLICLGALMLIAGAVLLWFWYDNAFTLELSVCGETEITMEYGGEYTDAGGEAIYFGKHFVKEPIPVEVSSEGSVDCAKTGTYEIRYSASFRGLQAEAIRTVQVVDTQVPEIELVSDPKKFTLPNHAYVEEGFTATDGYDGDLTEKVKREEKDGKVIYTVSDASGNTATATREIVYHDPNPPVLTLKGEAYVAIEAGASYKEPGYTAVDDCQGDITSDVKITGGVDPYQPGSYVLTYTVEDAYGNKASVQRTVTVLDLKEESIAEPNGKIIYLTFDDGPGAHTERLLDVLKKYNIKVTFFVVNTSYIGVISRAAKEGHTVAIHTKTHRFQDIYSSDDAFFADLYGMQSIIQQHTGETPMLMRFPGGSSNTISRSYNRGIMSRLTAAVREKGFQYFDWNVDSNDAGGASSAGEVFWNVVNGVSKCQNAVVLQHDVKGFSVNAVERIIIWGLTNGYRFQPLTIDSPGCHHGVLN